MHPNAKTQRPTVFTMRSVQTDFVSGFVAAINNVEQDLSVLTGLVDKVAFLIHSVKEIKSAPVESVLVRNLRIFKIYTLFFNKIIHFIL